MDKQYSKQFFSSFVHAIQQVCKTYLDFDEMVEISGYVAVEIDNSHRERYLLCELIHASGNVFSESYCTKAFKTMKPFHQPTDDLVRYRTKRKSREMPDLQLETLMPLKSPCATTSGSDCSLGVYRGHAEGTPHDMTCSSDRSREPSPVLVRAPSPCLHKRVSETQRNKIRDVAAASDISAPDNAFSRQTFVAESVSYGSKDSDAFSSGKTDALVIGKLSTTGTQIRGVPSGHSGESEVTIDKGLPVLKSKVSNRESMDSSVKDTEGEMMLGCPVPLLKKKHTKRPKASGAQSKATLLQSKQQAQDLKTKQNFSNVSATETIQTSGHHTSAKTVHSHQPKVSLCKITRLERQKSLCKRNIQSGHSSEGPQSEPTAAVEHISDCKCVGEQDPKYTPNVSGDKSDLKVCGTGVKVDLKASKSSSTGDSKDYDHNIRSSDSAGQENVKTSATETSSSGNAVHSDSHWKVPLPLPEEILRSDEDNGSWACMEDDISDLPEMNFDCEDEKDMGDVQEQKMELGAEQIPEDASPTDVDHNLNTAKKTKFHLNLLSSFLQKLGENRPVHTIPCHKLDTYIGTFFATVKKENGEEYGPTSLASIQSSIDRHLRKLQYPYSIKQDMEFHHSRKLLYARQKALTARGVGQKRTKKIDLITQKEVDILFSKEQLGTSSADTLLNTVWFMNNIQFGIMFSVNHYNLRWGDFELQVDEQGQEYLQMLGTTPDGDSSKRVYAKPENPARCYVNIFKKYRSVRPEETCKHDAPFYLTVNRFHHDDQPWFKFQNVGVNKLGSLMRRMAVAAGLDTEKFTSTAVMLRGEKVD